MADPVNPEGAELTQEPSGEGVVGSTRDRFQSQYRKISDDVRRGAERASAEIRRGRETAKDKYRDVAETAREKYEDVAETARDKYRDVADTARKSYTRVSSEAGNVSREVSLYVRDNPGKSVLLAAGVGFLIGLLVRRGGDDE
ncbi:MAG TPA: hypothetical protein VLT87_08170 [Thermoanaerobaculia bacterium]|nr:hypothetical protein [Thermoanaerobaculia bacterium]